MFQGEILTVATVLTVERGVVWRKKKYQQHNLSKLYIEIPKCQSFYLILRPLFIQIPTLFYSHLIIQDRTGCIEVLNYYLTEHGSIKKNK